MKSVLTLITDPAHVELDDGIVGEARAALNGLGAETAPPDWLSTGEACDIAFSGPPPDQAEAAVSLGLEGWPVDLIAQDADRRKKRLLIADMDSTIVAEETLDELAEFAGCKDKVARITERAMNGEVAFRDALAERVALLAGMDAAILDRCLARITLNPGAETLVRTMRANKAVTALVSGGFTTFTTHVREQVGFEVDRGNRLGVDGGKLTGAVLDPIVTKDVKKETLIELAGKHRIPMAETLAIGDGANDLPMLLAAGLGIAYHAKPVAAENARARIEHTGLTSALFAQGYPRDAFVS
jgi:phosphoserine phosphatase